jgi:iron(III) transport system substrate-binding protein
VRQRTWWSGAAAVLALALIMAACAAPAGPSTTAAPAAPTAAARTAAAPASAPAPPSRQAEWEQVLAAARREGTVTIAGNQVATYRESFLEFEKAYPEIRVEYASLSFGAYENRVRPERAAGIYSFDIAATGVGTPAFTDHSPAGWYEPLKPALYLPEVLDDSKWFGGFDGGFLDKGKQYIFGFGFTVQNYVQANRDMIPENALNSYADLLKPEFRGRIAIVSPRVPSSGSLQLTALRQVLGDDGLRRLLVDQAPIASDDRRQVAEWVVRGRYPIGIGLSDGMLVPFREEGLGQTVRAINPGGSAAIPAGNGSGTVMLLSNAPHPNAARVFVNWLLSREGQAAWTTRMGDNSRRLDAAHGNPQAVPDPAQVERYVNFQTEENQPLFDATIKLAQEFMP